MSPGMVSLVWDGHHEALIGVFEKLLEKSSFVDCTIAAEGQNLKAHKEVLSAFSPLFELLFKEEIEQNPTVVLGGISFQDLRALIHFMYHGKVELPANKVKEFLDAGECLQIKGVGEGHKQQSSGLTNERSYQEQTQISTIIPYKRKRKHTDEDISSVSPSKTDGNIESHSGVTTKPQSVSVDVNGGQSKPETCETDQTAQSKNQKLNVSHGALLLCNIPKDVGLEIIPVQAKPSLANKGSGLTAVKIGDLDRSTDSVDLVQRKNNLVGRPSCESSDKSDSAVVKEPHAGIGRSDSYEGILSGRVPPSVPVKSASPETSVRLEKTLPSRSCITSSAISESSSSVPHSSASSVNCVSPFTEKQDTLFHSEVDVKREPEEDDDEMLLSENEHLDQEEDDDDDDEDRGEMAAFETIYVSSATAEDDEEPSRLKRSSETREGLSDGGKVRLLSDVMDQEESADTSEDDVRPSPALAQQKKNRDQKILNKKLGNGDESNHLLTRNQDSHRDASSEADQRQLVLDLRRKLDETVRENEHLKTKAANKNEEPSELKSFMEDKFTALVNSVTTLHSQNFRTIQELRKEVKDLKDMLCGNSYSTTPIATAEASYDLPPPPPPPPPPSLEQMVDLGSGVFCAKWAVDAMESNEDNHADWANSILKGVFKENAALMRVKPKRKSEQKFHRFPDNFLNIAKSLHRLWLARQTAIVDGFTQPRYTMDQVEELVARLPGYLSDRSAGLLGPRGKNSSEQVAKKVAKESQSLTSEQKAKRKYVRRGSNIVGSHHNSTPTASTAQGMPTVSASAGTVDILWEMQPNQF